MPGRIWVGRWSGRPIAWLLRLPMGNIRGAGSLRERRPDVWEVRVALGPDPVSGRSRVRSITVHGDQEMARAAQVRWAAEAGVVRMRRHAWPGMTVAELLAEWIAADHGWRPSTLVGYRSAAKHVAYDLRTPLKPLTVDAAPRPPPQAGQTSLDLGLSSGRGELAV